MSQHSITILGSGESGMGAALLAAEKGYGVFVSDSRSISEENIQMLAGKNISYEEKGHTLEKILNSQLVIKSPGIPEEAKIIKELKDAGIPVISEIEFAAKFSNAKFIAITGSNGKTTTTLLTYHLLKNSGLNVGLAGNIGNSLSKLILKEDFDIIVLELSSFQLDGMYEFVADTSILLNITPDHLDRYDHDLNKYADAKLRIVQNQTSSNVLIFNADNDLILKKLKNIEKAFRLIQFSINKQPKSGAYLLNDQLIFVHQNTQNKIPTKELSIIGKHNYYNVMASVLTALHYNIDFDSIKRAISTFKNAPHRLEIVADVEGVRFINDSKATNVDSVFYALDGMDRRIVWIAGGVNKGNDYDVLKSLVGQKVKALVCMGSDNRHLFDAFGRDVEVIKEVYNAKDAVDQSFALANPGDVVLLSPACASFDLFKNYEARGVEFKKAVFELKKKFEMEVAV